MGVGRREDQRDHHVSRQKGTTVAERFDGEFTSNRKDKKYDWDKWLDGDIWLLTEGEDFDTVGNLRSAGRSWLMHRQMIDSKNLRILKHSEGKYLLRLEDRR